MCLVKAIIGGIVKKYTGCFYRWLWFWYLNNETRNKEMNMKKTVITVCLVVVVLLSVGSFAMAEDMPEPDGDAL